MERSKGNGGKQDKHKPRKLARLHANGKAAGEMGAVRGKSAVAGTKSATVDNEWDVDLKQLAQPINGNKPRRDATRCDAGTRQDEARQGEARRGDSMRRLIKTMLHGGEEFSNQSASTCGKIGKIRQLANGRWEFPCALSLDEQLLDRNIA